MLRPIGILASLFLVCCASAAMAQGAVRNVIAQAPVQREVTRYLQSTGTVQAVNSVDLVARVSGTLDRVAFEDGAQVRKGDVIFVIEQEPYRISLAAAAAELAQSRANLEEASANLARQQALAARQVVSESALDSAVAQQKTAAAQVAASQTKVRSAELNLGYTEIRAPFDGILAARVMDPGAYINAASAPKLASLIQPDPVYVLFSASEQQVIAVRKALGERNIPVGGYGAIAVEVGLQTESGYPHVGKLDYVAPELDAGSGVVTVRGVVENPSRLFSPGMFARVRIPLATHRALAIPEAAIGNSQLGRTVLVIGEGGRAEQRRVTVGDALGDGVREIVDGLTEADRVIVRGAGGVRPGDTVAVVDRL
ncbi:efflux RND transporter periplasmic adaptor subunit [Pseudochelatococcus sp.]|jgi:multidrug efflux system membrane fusion protein|uniref:efflux RND transporter periplasmic adaptor subunit n=1 Tax=Pseudochelatococcus sp. TaxID=2020869 RepID=UPI003D8A002E